MKYDNSEKTFSKLISCIKQNRQSRTASTERQLKQTNFIKYNKSSFPQQENSNINSKQKDRFKKHQNLIETNKENIHRMSSIRIGDGRINLFQIKTIRNSGKISFQPKEFKEIEARSRFSLQDEVPLQLNQLTLEGVLVKEHLKSKRSLMSYNILQLEKRYNYSRFELHTLYSIYQTLLIDAKQSTAKFKNGFEVMLNMNRVCLRPQVLEKIFSEQKLIDFANFLEMNNKIDQIVFKQNITDYVQILFEGMTDKNKIHFDDIIRVFKHRITEKESIDVAKIIFDQYDKNYEGCIKLQEITELCQACESFAQKMYKLYNRELKFQ